MIERLCKNCKHFENESDPSKIHLLGCYVFKGKQHPVFGNNITSIDAGLMRLTLCGWKDPKFWEPK